MFEIRFFVDDKKLPAVHWALEGIALAHPGIKTIPVRGATVKGGKAQASSDDSASAGVAKIIRKSGVSEVSTGDIRAALVTNKFQPSGAGYVVKHLMKDKILARTKKTGIYRVL